MGNIQIENVSFTYPNRKNKALDNINISIKKGEFVTVCGKSGCGKTTLLRILKPAIAPFGDICGNIFFGNKDLYKMDSREQTTKIGFVMQSPDNQIVTDKVWHELAFGLESLGVSTSEIRLRVAEMASFFGIEEWFHKKVTDLSGGQKQLLNLASVMVLQPSVLILDEPTSQLDPIACGEFINTLRKINRELGTTIILSEHRLEEAFPVSDRVIVMDEGRIIADDTPYNVGEILKSQSHDMFLALPTPIRVFGAVENNLDCPVTVRDGREWLEELTKTTPANPDLIPKAKKKVFSETVIQAKDVHFRYEKNSSDIIKGLDLKINKGELFALVGGNGTGKTTTLSLLSGLYTPYRGEIFINGKKISKNHNLYGSILAVLPQNPQSVFVKKTVYLDLCEMLSETKLSDAEKNSRIRQIASLCHIENLLESHPYDLSGGEQQRAALAKVLLMSPEILLLDEPTKGLDAQFKQIFAEIICSLKRNGVTVVMVSHDIEFCAEFADRCAFVFDGKITSCDEPRAFFGGKSFYTTCANRMARTILPDAILADDIILALGGIVREKTTHTPQQNISQSNKGTEIPLVTKKTSLSRIIIGVIFALLFILSTLLITTHTDTVLFSKLSFINTNTLQIFACISIAIVLFCFVPQKEFGVEIRNKTKESKKLTKRTLLATLFILIAIPLTIYLGTSYLGDRKYYFISLLIILETIIPFCAIFENRKPKARELVIISVLCAIAVAGRAAFFALPQFKPVVALVIIAGICFGGETGFLVGAVTGFVSNFFFGQGPWAPWQMFTFGIIGFIAGILFRKGILKKTRISLCIFGFVTTFIIYGGIMNPASVIMWQNKITWEMIASAYILAIPFDIVHALSTAFFLWFISEPMVEKLERIKVKYGLLS